MEAGSGKEALGRRREATRFAGDVSPEAKVVPRYSLVFKVDVSRYLCVSIK
jgi:hypothetical protein